MRYYSIQITNQTSGAMVRQWTSHPYGTNAPPDPGAQNVELDIVVWQMADPGGNSFVRIWGISLQDIGQASSFANMNIAVYAGMGVGLPLANPTEAGLLFSGYVYQAFGNWQGVNMTLDLLVQAGTATLPAGATGGTPAVNLTLNWKKGTPLSAAIAQTLRAGYPNFQQNIRISPNLVLAHDEAGFYGSIVQFASYVQARSTDVIGGNYQGVRIQLTQTTFNVYDGTTQTNPKTIAFNDMIGQVTWIAFNTVQLNCVMRADLHVGDYIKMPPGQVSTTAQSYSQFRQGSVFQGTFQISRIRHVGNFRQPMGEAWISTIDAYTSAAG